MVVNAMFGAGRLISRPAGYLLSWPPIPIALSWHMNRKDPFCAETLTLFGNRLDRALGYEAS
jgi:hypothetical protein